jgi:hypothetical protein
VNRVEEFGIAIAIKRAPCPPLTNDFGSAPTVSSEKSIFSDCAALAHVSSAARPTAVMTILVMRLLVFILDLRFCSGVQRFAAGRRVHDQAITISSGRPVKNSVTRAGDPAIFFGRISCRCRIQSYMSLRNSFSRRLVVDLDTACKCSIQLVLQW